MPYLPYTMQKEETTMESYVERWAREQKEAQKEQKSRKRRKEVNEDGTDSRSEGHEAQAESGGGE